MNQNKTVVFVCEHGAAKSVIAATYFNKLACEQNLNIHAVARGIHPDEELSSKTIVGLHEDGMTPTESIPQKLSLADLESAEQIITFCELPEEYQKKVNMEQWNDVPPVSENYEKARDTILVKLKLLMKPTI